MLHWNGHELLIIPPPKGGGFLLWTGQYFQGVGVMMM